jgi:hypothetical protein
MQIPSAIQLIEETSNRPLDGSYEADIRLQYSGNGMHNMVEVAVEVKVNMDHVTEDAIPLYSLDVFIVFDINSGAYVDSYELQVNQ